MYRVGENRDRFVPMSLNASCRTDGYMRKVCETFDIRDISARGRIIQGFEHITNELLKAERSEYYEYN